MKQVYKKLWEIDAYIDLNRVIFAVVKKTEMINPREEKCLKNEDLNDLGEDRTRKV